MIEVFYHLYYLTPRHAMNAVTTASIRQGSLLKWVWPDGKVGFSDVHPWTEFGDWSLAHQIENLRQGQLSPIVKQSRWLAERDAEARALKKNLLSSRPQLKNNYTLLSVQDVAPELLDFLHEQGFETIKVKMGRDLDKEIAALSEISRSGFRIRLDFNSSLTSESFKSFVGRLSDEVLAQIEYVEDPFAFDLEKWGEANALIPLAIDQEIFKVVWSKIDKNPFNVVVLKPAKTAVPPVVAECKARGLKVTVTSNMDHLIGVVHAAALAEELFLQEGGLILQAGCLTYQAYQSEQFSMLAKSSGPYILPVAGFGVGFDQPLAEIPWQPLVRL